MKIRARPAQRIYHSAVYDSSMSRILMFGGQERHHWGMDLLDVWSCDIDTNHWESLGVLEAGETYSVALDIRTGCVIMLNMLGETWAYSISSGLWQKRNPPAGPSGRGGHRMVYNSGADKTILFGGFRCRSLEDPLQNDTWAYDYDSDRWEAIPCDSSPRPRIYHSMVYHVAADRILLWGGRPFDEKDDRALWAFDYHSGEWTPLETSDGPMHRYSYATMVYDPLTEDVIMFGGLDLDSVFTGRLVEETWTFDFQNRAWAPRQTGTVPSGRSHHVMVFDTDSRRAVVLGGEIGSAYSNSVTDEIWIYDPEVDQWVSPPEI